MSVETDRETFRAKAVEADKLAVAGDSDGANVITSEMEKLANVYQERGELVEFARPLLEASEELQVRYNASTILLGAGESELAVPVLEELSRAKGLTGTTARMVLNYWKRQSQT